MTVRILIGDALAHLQTLDAESFDAIVTDPPYHLTTGKKSGSGPASLNPNSPAGRSRIGTGFMGKAWDGGDVAFRPETWAAALRVAKPGAHLVAFGGTRTWHRLACAIEDAGWEIRDCLSWLYGSGFPKSHNGPWGGTALKPAYEPIVLARKPVVGTVAANVLAHGTGALNIDACWIEPTGESLGGGRVSSRADGWDRPWKANAEAVAAAHERGAANVEKSETLGRWPANVVLDEDAAQLLDQQTGELTSGFMAAGTQREGLGYHGALGTSVRHGTRGDTGGASRFFYTAKASRSERNFGLDGFAERPLNWSSGEQSPGTFQSEDTKKSARNAHPTVKPIDLMRWLVRLVTPPHGTVLDPFVGSGSTGIASIAEAFGFVGIELDPEYARIAEARLAAAQPSLFAEVIA